MKQDIISMLLLSAAFTLLFGLAELLWRKAGWKAEQTRKLVHAGTGILTILFPIMLSSHWWVLVLCSGFFIILVGSIYWGWLPSIHAIERKSLGSLLFPVSVYICFLFYEMNGALLALFYMPILVLAICDPIAAMVGTRFPIGKMQVLGGRKTLAGTSAFFIAALAVIYFCCMVWPVAFTTPKALTIIAIALAATLAELISKNGSDNLSIPLIMIFILYFVV